MASITTRSGKGSPLTNAEVDANFTNLNDKKVEKDADTGAASIPVGTEAQRPGSPAAGMFRFNDDSDQFEGYDGTAWGEIGGGGSGTVTSVDVSGGTTGLTTSGGPVTTSGTVTLAGTLAAANGGTGQTTYSNGQLLIGKTDGSLAKATLTAGSNVTITNGDGAITIASTGGGGGGGGGTSVTVTQITATAAQTDFSVTYTVGQLSVYLNGALLASADYTASNGTTVVLASGAASGDIFTALAYDSATQITQGDTKVEVTDSGTGKVEVTVDNVEVADFTTGEIVFNETGANQDFRVEGDTDANLLFVDAGNDRIGIGTNTPSGLFDVANRGITKGSLPAGSVLQVVSTTKTDTFSESIGARGLSGDVTGLTATITPTSASSRLLVYAVINTSFAGEGNSATCGFRFYRDGSAVLIGDARGSRNADTVGRNFSGAGADIFNTFSFGEVLANATASTTFTIRLRNNTGDTNTVFLNRSGVDTDDNARSTPISSIMVMEIAA